MNTKNHQIRIIIYIIIGAVIAAAGVFLVLHSNNSKSGISLQDKLDLGHKYLVELSYDKAVLEFTDAIEIDPMNADSYLGLADAYIGQGDSDKAVEVLEKGFDKTGDDRIKEKLDELKPVEEETTVSETAETNEIETIRQQTYDILASFYPYMPTGEPNSTVYAYSYLDDREIRGMNEYYCYKFEYDSNGNLYKEYQENLITFSDTCTIGYGNIITYGKNGSRVGFHNINSSYIDYREELHLVSCDGDLYCGSNTYPFYLLRSVDGIQISENEYEFDSIESDDRIKVYIENGVINKIDMIWSVLYYDESTLMWREERPDRDRTPYKLGLPKNLDSSIFDVEDKIEKTFPNSNEMRDYIRSIQQ